MACKWDIVSAFVSILTRNKGSKGTAIRNRNMQNTLIFLVRMGCGCSSERNGTGECSHSDAVVSSSRHYHHFRVLQQLKFQTQRMPFVLLVSTEWNAPVNSDAPNNKRNMSRFQRR